MRSKKIGDVQDQMERLLLGCCTWPPLLCLLRCTLGPAPLAVDFVWRVLIEDVALVDDRVDEVRVAG
jgi:hypothetical protein